MLTNCLNLNKFPKKGYCIKIITKQMFSNTQLKTAKQKIYQVTWSPYIFSDKITLDA